MKSDMKYGWKTLEELKLHKKDISRTATIQAVGIAIGVAAILLILFTYTR